MKKEEAHQTHSMKPESDKGTHTQNMKDKFPS
jgi:hypothetical protein